VTYLAVWVICGGFSRARGIFLRESLSKVAAIATNLAATAATLDSDSRRKIPREKFRTKINTPRARDSYHNFET
jgi:hypothetical protein